MKRRTFVSLGSVFSAGFLAGSRIDILPGSELLSGREPVQDLYEIFKNPGLTYHPFVRWWWNGNKVEAAELIRELRLLKEAGIGGVEINPVDFPTRSEGDDLGKPSVRWLSKEWLDLLKVVFDEAKLLGMTCDLIVGSGWPFGAETLAFDERAQIAVIAVKKLTGPLEYEVSKFELFREADPPVSSPFTGRTMELLSVYLVPDPLSGLDKVTDLSSQKNNETIKALVPAGKHAIYGLVKINGFMQVINGAPGATGPVLDHYSAEAVRRYLNRMSETIENQTGLMSTNLRALFTDSLELEGANWSAGIMEEFKQRRGYDIFPYLPFVLFRTGGMGNVTDFKYGVTFTPDFEEMIARMRYDFEFTKSELLEERFIRTYTGWCRDLKVKSRAQAYGRGFFPLEGSFSYDIPESESWTMNWLKHRVGEEMPEDDYRRGRAYTMINKYVSSAANLTGKRLVSCEEMTDTYTVFNTSLENLKIGGDQSAITGVSHSIFHGFNYSPPEAPYPGWIRYGAYYNENNTWWPHFNLYNKYKGRMSALLQHVTMYTDIAILPPLDDMWSLIGQQMEPFPSITHVDWFTLVWEAINKNGSGCDYVSQAVIRNAEMKSGFMIFGPRKYKTIFLIKVDSLHPAAAKKLLDFVTSGGRIFCIENAPSASLGFNNYKANDRQVAGYIDRMKSFPERFIILDKPEKDFIGWYRGIQDKYGIKPYLKIEQPDPYVMQNRYVTDDGSEIIYMINSHIYNSHTTRIIFPKEITSGKYGWKWDPETGNRYRITLDRENGIELEMGPAESFIFVFDKEKMGTKWNPCPASGTSEMTVYEGWDADFIHCRDDSVKSLKMNRLKDIKDIPEFVNFAGEIIYRNRIEILKAEINYLNPGKVWGLCSLKVNGSDCGVKWYGRRIFDVKDLIKSGINEIEIRVVTSMGNYMKSLTDNPIAQYWTNEKNKIQPVQSMGLIGPVTLY